MQPLDVLRRIWSAESGLDTRERAVLTALVMRADERGQCWPSLSRIAADTGLGRRTVMRALNELAAGGWVRRTRRERPDPTLYTVLFDRATETLGHSDPRATETLEVGSQRHRDRVTVTPELPIELPIELPTRGADAPGSASRATKGGAKKDSRPSWLAPYAEAWAAEMGGAPPYGRIGAALRPLRANYDDADILAVWRWYLRSRREAGRAAYATPQDFAARFGAYRDEMRGAAAPAKAGGAMSARRYAETIDWSRYETEDDR